MNRSAPRWPDWPGGWPEARHERWRGRETFEGMGRRPDFVASSVFHDRFGEEMLLVLYHPDLVEEYRVPPK